MDQALLDVRKSVKWRVRLVGLKGSAENETSSSCNNGWKGAEGHIEENPWLSFPGQQP